MDFPRRGEIYFIDFPATGASEMAGPHPALVVQNDVGNQASQLTIVAAITSNLRVSRLPRGSSNFLAGVRAAEALGRSSGPPLHRG